MELALSHPKYGYYITRDPFGTEGDFITAPEISQLFGEMIGIWCAYSWQQMGCPEHILLVELGPGRGTLMQDALRATRHISGFHQAISVHMVETSPVLARLQQEKLAGCHPRINWHLEFQEVPAIPMLLVANEFFDALPVHQYISIGGKFHEQYVGIDKLTGELAFTLSPIHIALPAHDYPDGAMFERCPVGEMIAADIAGRIRDHGGAALVIDYGYKREELKEYAGSVQAVKAHHYQKLLDHLGEADITAHVDFSALSTAMGKDVQSFYTTQGAFLTHMGIDNRAMMLAEKATPKQAEDLRNAVDRLVSSHNMGELFKVMAICPHHQPPPAGFQ